MMMGPFYFKLKGRESLKGNWQTAMVIAFFSGILMTVSEVLVSLYMPNVYAYSNGEQFWLAVGQVSRMAVVALAVVNLLSALVTPALSLGCKHYFVRRLAGEELGAAGLWSRFGSFGRAFWLYLVMGVRILLWGLLLVVPGIIAAIRYSMAPYYLAEHPEMTATQAIEASKTAMSGQKMSLFTLEVSFVGWALLSYAVQLMLLSLSSVLATVAGLFIQVWLSAYMNAAIASFYDTVSRQGGMEKASQEIQSRMREMGVDTSAWEAAEEQRRKEAQDDGAQDAQEAPGGEAESETKKADQSGPGEDGGTE